MILTVKGFSVVNEAEVDVFLEFPHFVNDPEDAGNLFPGCLHHSSFIVNLEARFYQFCNFVHFQHCVDYTAFFFF